MQIRSFSTSSPRKVDPISTATAVKAVGVFSTASSLPALTIISLVILFPLAIATYENIDGLRELFYGPNTEYMPITEEDFRIYTYEMLKNYFVFYNKMMPMSGVMNNLVHITSHYNDASLKTEELWRGYTCLKLILPVIDGLNSNLTLQLDLIQDLINKYPEYYTFTQVYLDAYKQASDSLDEYGRLTTTLLRNFRQVEMGLLVRFRINDLHDLFLSEDPSD
jgi:hypothetical protein